MPLLIAVTICSSLFAWGLYSGRYKTFPFWYLRILDHYLWRVRSDAPVIFSNTRGRLESACPRSVTVIVAIGQSNAANAVPTLAQRRNVPAYNFYDGKCYAVEDPLLGTTGNLGSLWTPLAQTLATTGSPFVLIAGAVWGSAIAQWLPGRTGYWSRVADQIAQAHRSGLTADIVIWLQGETDAAASTSRGMYRDSLVALIDLSRAQSVDASRPAWIIIQATTCIGELGGSVDIRAAQADVSTERTSAYLGMDADALDWRYRYDGCHFNAAGRSMIVDAIAELIKHKQLIQPRNVRLLPPANWPVGRRRLMPNQ